MSETQLTIPAGHFSAYLFDLDGTIADSMPIHYLSWQQAVAENGGTFPEDVFYSLGGVPFIRTVELLNERYGTHMDPVKTAERKEELYLTMIPKVQPIAATVAVINAAYGKIPFAVVSGSPRASIAKTLTTLGLLDKFPVLVGAEDYTHGKPSPEPFLVGAAKLNVPAAECLVFEDADAGIVSAEAAGMKWVRVPQNREAAMRVAAATGK